MNNCELKLEVYYGSKAPWSNTTLLFSGDNALLIDAQFQKSDAREIVKILNNAGKTLTTILLTHSHPDHVWGGAEILNAFPNAKAYARHAVINEINLEYRARLLRWTGFFDDELPVELFPIEPLEGDSFVFDGHEIKMIDGKPSETIHLTTFYIPELKTYVASDQIYNRCHYYVGPGLNRPELWIEAIKDAWENYDIERVVPGHGPVGGTEMFQEAIDYLTYYGEVAKPLVSQQKIAHALLEKYPDWRMEGVLYMTIGPAVTAKELVEETGGKTSFGTQRLAEGYYRA